MPERHLHCRPRRASHSRGLSLIEICVGLAVVGLLVALAWPSQMAQLQRARRLDATAALTRLQFAQEQYRSRYGSYSAELAALTGASSTRSGEGLYELSLRDAQGARVTLTAQARSGGPQQDDRECREITLQLNQGQADPGPDSRCWNQ